MGGKKCKHVGVILFLQVYICEPQSLYKQFAVTFIILTLMETSDSYLHYRICIAQHLKCKIEFIFYDVS